MSFQILHFDCMRFGQDSIAFLKPDEDGGLMQPEGEQSEGGMEDAMVVYDHVDDNKKANITVVDGATMDGETETVIVYDNVDDKKRRNVTDTTA